MTRTTLRLPELTEALEHALLDVKDQAVDGLATTAIEGSQYVVFDTPRSKHAAASVGTVNDVLTPMC